jgi:hypothetical protein
MRRGPLPLGTMAPVACLQPMGHSAGILPDMNNLFFYDAQAPAGEALEARRLALPDQTFLISEGGASSPEWLRIDHRPVLSMHPRMLPSLLSRDCDQASRRTFIVDCNDAPELSRLLVLFRSAKGVDVFAPKTNHYYKNRPMFINSVPKCGTHLLSTCLEEMGFTPPPFDAMPDFAGTFDDGKYYNLQHMRVDDIADQYRRIGPFVDALSKSAIVFITRDPRDAIVSLADYIPRQREYHLLSRFMENMAVEERINTIIRGDYPIPVFINDRYCLDGSIATLFGSYERWRTELWQNLWRIRYEDLIGPKGLGTLEAQLEAIWGLQLALHVPGNPARFARKVFSEHSPTFFKGTIGRFQTEFSAANHQALDAVSADFIQRAGYADRWQICRSFKICIAALESEVVRETALGLYCEISTRGRGDFAVVIDRELGSSSPQKAVVSVQSKSSDGAAEPGAAEFHVTVQPGAKGTARYRCFVAVPNPAREVAKVEWESPSIADVSRQIVAFCAVHQICARIDEPAGIDGEAAASDPDALRSDSARSAQIVAISAFRGSLSNPLAPSVSRPAGLPHLLRLSMALLHLV